MIKRLVNIYNYFIKVLKQLIKTTLDIGLCKRLCKKNYTYFIVKTKTLNLFEKYIFSYEKSYYHIHLFFWKL